MSETSKQELREAISEIRRLLAQRTAEPVIAFVEPLHPSDLADLVEHLDAEERLTLWVIVPAPLASEALAEMEEEEHPAELLAQMEPARIAELVEELADDDAADLIGDLEPDEQERILDSVPTSEEIRELLEYPEESAGGIMTREMVVVRAQDTAHETIESLREHANDREDLYTVFVVDNRDRLKGVVTLRDLVLAAPTTLILDMLEQPVAVVPVDMDQEEVGKILSRYNLASIGVVDDSGKLVGSITFDDVIDVVEAETTEDILRFASVSDEEQLRGTTLGAIRSRLRWLIVNSLTLSVAALVVWA